MMLFSYYSSEKNSCSCLVQKFPSCALDSMFSIQLCLFDAILKLIINFLVIPLILRFEHNFCFFLSFTIWVKQKTLYVILDSASNRNDFLENKSAIEIGFFSVLNFDFLFSLIIANFALMIFGSVCTNLVLNTDHTGDGSSLIVFCPRRFKWVWYLRELFLI